MNQTETTQPSRADYLAARQVWADFRHAHGRAHRPAPLLTDPSGNLKFERSERAIYGLAFAQSRISGHNVCPWSTPNCVAACVGHNNRAGMPEQKRGQVIRTLFFFEHKAEFITILATEIFRAIAKHGADKVAFRLNTFSDIDWQDEAPELFGIPGAQFYDYTKDWDREAIFANYDLSYSATERTTTEEIADKVNDGHNVAVVLRVRGGRIRGTTDYRDIPETFHGLTMVDADVQDDWTTRHRGVVGGLRAKGSKMLALPMAKEAVA